MVFTTTRSRTKCTQFLLDPSLAVLFLQLSSANIECSCCSHDDAAAVTNHIAVYKVQEAQYWSSKHFAHKLCCMLAWLSCPCSFQALMINAAVAVMTTLVLREMQEAQIQSFEEDPQALQDACDVAAFVFDGSNIASFKAAQDLLLKLAQLADDTIPCVLIAAKDDLGISMVISALVNPLNRLRAILPFMLCMLHHVANLFVLCSQCVFYYYSAPSTDELTLGKRGTAPLFLIAAARWLWTYHLSLFGAAQIQHKCCVLCVAYSPCLLHTALLDIHLQ